MSRTRPTDGRRPRRGDSRHAGSRRRRKRRRPDVRADRGISPAVGIALLFAIVVLLAMTVGVIVFGMQDRLEPVDILAEGQCAADRVVEFDGDVASFHDELTKDPCVLWLDASHVETDGPISVHRWLDRGPNGFDAVQSNSSLRPHRIANPPGISEPAIRFRGNGSGGYQNGAGEFVNYGYGDSLVIDRDVGDLDVAGDAEITVVAYVRTISFDRGGTWTIGEAGQDGREFSMRTCGGISCGTGAGGPHDHWRAQLWGSADVDFEADSHQEWIVMTQMYDGTDTVIRVDGNQLAAEQTDLDLSRSRDIQIGRWERLGDDPHFYYNGYIAEVLIFDRALEPDELEAVESYMEEKYG